VNEIEEEMIQVQLRFDRETGNYYMNMIKEVEWEERIARELNSLKEYI
jgi:hypothetical protein